MNDTPRMSDRGKRQGATGREAMRRGGGLWRLPDLLGKVLDPASRRRGLAEAGVLTDWPSIVGEALAARCQPVKLTGGGHGHGGILHVHVAGSAALELQHSEPQLLERINSYFGYPAVARLRLIRAPLALPRRVPAAARGTARSGGASGDRGGRAARRGRRAARGAERARGGAQGAGWSSIITGREARIMARAFRNVSMGASARGLLLLLLAVVAGCANSAGKPSKIQRMLLEPARAAEERGDYVAAFRNYLSAAKDGVVYAQLKVAGFYEEGRGTATDDAEAARWYQAAADRGVARAQRNLARMYETGRGVPQDDARALALYREAAAGGEASAHYKVGQLTETGRGTAADPMAAVEHYRAAAQAGEVDAQLALARLFRTDEGNVPEDAERSAQWYGEAIEQLEADARSGDAQASERLGDLYLNGRGAPANVDMAVAHYEAAARSGRTGAQLKLARLLHEGADGVPPIPRRRPSISRWRPTRATPAPSMRWRRCTPKARACRRMARGR